MERLRSLNYIWFHFSNNRLHTIAWCPRARIWLSRHSIVARSGAAPDQRTIQSIQEQWLDILSESTCNTFLLRLDIEADKIAVGWRRVDGEWAISKDDTDRATRGVMFAQAEDADPETERRDRYAYSMIAVA